MDRLKVLIVGGYGTFGGRLAQLLADEPRLTLLIAGRSLDAASAFCSRLPGSAKLIPTTFDRRGDLGRQLGALVPDFVVDASGPFQVYGTDPYRLVQACIEAGLDYADLADGSGFVAGIEAFDAEAKRRGVTILSGASSFPVLTAAVVRHLAADMARVETITGGIAPSPFAGVGLNVIRAIATYAGQPVEVRRDGTTRRAHPLTETRRYTIAPPGGLPLHDKLFSLVDVPDLVLVPRVRPEARAVWIGAGPVPAVFHRMLIGLAWLVRLRVVPSLAPLAPLFLRVVNRLRWGEHRGGMFVEVSGTDRGGRPVTKSWHLLAEGADGPLIPSMAIEALVRKRLDGVRPAAGARSAIDALDLGDYERLFAGRTIRTGTRRDLAEERSLPLYKRLLGNAWELLPEAARALHDGTASSHAEGCADVERGAHPLARTVAWIFGFPPAGTNVPLSVTFERGGMGETWVRRFGRHSFRSAQAEGSGRWQRLLVERFGPVSFGVALVVDGERLHFVVRRWALLGLPLPLRLAPVSRAWEGESGGCFRFDIDLSHPLFGRIVRYRGWLRTAAPAGEPLAHVERRPPFSPEPGASGGAG